MIRRMHEFQYPPVSEMQIRALEYLIWKSKDAQLFAKQLAIWLIRQSEFLSTPCCVHIPACSEKFSLTGQDGFHDMVSGNASTHLNEVMCAMGTVMKLSQHGGDVLRNNLGGQDGTFWVTTFADNYSRTAKELELNLGEIQAIEIDA